MHGEEEAAALRSAAGASRRRSPLAAALSSGGGAVEARVRRGRGIEGKRECRESEGISTVLPSQKILWRI
jgi:hypothetical protein